MHLGFVHVAFLSAFVVSWAAAKVYLKEQFDDGDDWTDRWVQSQYRSDYGKFQLSAGSFYGDSEADKGMKTGESSKFYSMARKLDEPFSSKGKSLVLQFSVKHEQKIDCGGGYIKLLPEATNLREFGGNSPYYLMFGPDICGADKKKVQVIFTYRGKNLLIKKEIACKDDEYSHLYTLIIRPDKTYEVLIDNEKAAGGNLEDDWDFFPERKIKDPHAKKPKDWQDKEYIDDPEDLKPEDWDQPEYIPDPDAKKPSDWDDEIDGPFEPGMIDNPNYKGDWKPKQKKNPQYQGTWVHPVIDNPDYVDDPNFYAFDNIGAVGFDLWQVRAGTIFDNILVADDVDFASKFAAETWAKTKEGEKKMREKQEGKGSRRPGRRDPDEDEEEVKDHEEL